MASALRRSSYDSQHQEIGSRREPSGEAWGSIRDVGIAVVLLGVLVALAQSPRCHACSSIWKMMAGTDSQRFSGTNSRGRYEPH